MDITTPSGFSGETGTDLPAVAELLIEQVLRALPDRTREELTEAVLGLLRELQPENALQGLLVSQMAGCHFLALDQMKMAAKASGSVRSQQVHLQLATKLQRTFVSQVEALLKLKGFHQQRIRVDHIHVHEGGQAAFIGEVKTDRKGGS
ncbi:MAG: hypothetical protein AB7F21_07055 [Desulfuromonadales bacterium]